MIVFPWMNVGSLRLHMLLMMDGFSFTRIELIDGNSRNPAIKAHFANETSLDAASDFIQSGYIVFDPQVYYRPLRYHYVFKSPAAETIMTGELVYVDEREVPILQKVLETSETHSKRKGKFYGRLVQTFSGMKLNEYIPDSAFTLTAFGLPEPPGVDWTPPTPWYVYAGAAGIVLFALCFGFGVWKQRLKARGFDKR